ncbi:unnamed protein product [Dimorphilus gyrociliatus]|uniref:Uncharacterized protein n=1 Tax=Dimorphilus gyrociliatus TaxID=2664684 RepID=A0A7I8WEQ5_9ANNE|nr:unnamed protein product [Dimorphilus gyrociliatus]
MARLEIINLSISDFNHLDFEDSKILKIMMHMIKTRQLRYFNSQRFELKVSIEDNIQTIYITDRFESFELVMDIYVEEDDHDNERGLGNRKPGKKFQQIWHMISIMAGFDLLLNEIIQCYNITAFKLNDHSLLSNQLAKLEILFQTFNQTLRVVKFNCRTIDKEVVETLNNYMNILNNLQSFSIVASSSVDNCLELLIDKLLQTCFCSNLKNLEINLSSYYNVEVSLKRVLERCQNLERIDISGVNVSFKQLKEFEDDRRFSDKIDSLQLKTCFLRDELLEILRNYHVRRICHQDREHLHYRH